MKLAPTSDGGAGGGGHSVELVGTSLCLSLTTSSMVLVFFSQAVVPRCPCIWRESSGDLKKS